MTPMQPPRTTPATIYYQGRASGLGPLIATGKTALLLALSLVGYWLLDPGVRETVQERAGPGFVANGLQAFKDMEYSKPVAEILRVSLLALGAAMFLKSIWIWIGWNGTYYLVTSERIQYEQGLLAKSIKTIDLWRVRDLIFQRSMLEALCGIGSVVVVANDATARYSKIGPVVGGRRLYDDLMEARAAAIRERGVAAVET